MTTYTYDETGQILSSTDPCGNATCTDVSGPYTTTYSYADKYTVLSGGQNVSYTPTGNTNAYLTQITDPLGYHDKFTYDFNNGQLTASQDQNDINAGSAGTTYLYNDPFSRPTQVSFPDGGQTSTAYNDSPYNPNANPPTPNVTATQLISSSLSKTTVAEMDGIGHVLHTVLSSDPEGADTTDTTYYGTGNVFTKSNPHRSGSSSTDGTTTYTPDALGRTRAVSEPDTSVVTTTYDIPGSNSVCTKVTDEAGKSRESCTNGLGRLMQVFEDPGSSPHLNYETDYAYDGLGDLLTVNQKGGDPNSADWRPRTFTYDSLSRLTQAVNPESGTIFYTYDANGNVASKLAPAPNQTGSSTVTTNYTYDALNRIASKSYLGMSTPPAKYGYDGVALTGCTISPQPDTDSYPIGRRTSMCDGSGATSFTHDMMGRSKQERRTIGSVSGDYDTDQYNLDGSVASVTALGYDVNYVYNAAGRPVSAIHYTGGTVNYLNSAKYAPFGGLSSASMGPKPISITDIYNSRLQPCWLYGTTGTALAASSLCTATASTGTIQDLKYNFGLGVNDNGNVIQILNNRDSNRTQNFMYDSLNRIQQAYSSGTNWGETYSSTATAPGVAPSTSGIDPWGNLTNISGVTGKNLSGSLSCPANTNNQLTTCSLTYDAAGNVMQNGSTTYTYDAENRLVATAGTSYIYDGDGERVEKCTEGSTAGACASGATGTLYWKGGGSEAQLETDLSGNAVANYIFFGGRRIARRDVSTNTVHYYFSDHLGTHSLITDQNGDMPPQYEADFDPYGIEMVLTSGDTNHYKFTGKERDTESGLDDFPARYFTSSMGRWMTPDPMGGHAEDPQTLNRYAYARNNPVSLTDPTGLDSYLSCTHTDQNGSTCHQQTVGYDKNGNAQQAWVQGTSDKNGSFTATLIGNDANGNLVDKTTGTGSYTASVNGSGVEFSNNGGQTSSSGVFVNGTPQTTFQDAGWANGNALSGFTFTLTNSKLEAGQTEAGTFFGIGNKNQIESAIEAAGFKYHFLGLDRGFDEYRSPGDPHTGANSGHFNVDQAHQNPLVGVPVTPGNMHFGEHNPFTSPLQHLGEQK